MGGLKSFEQSENTCCPNKNLVLPSTKTPLNVLGRRHLLVVASKVSSAWFQKNLTFSFVKKKL